MFRNGERETDTITATDFTLTQSLQWNVQRYFRKITQMLASTIRSLDRPGNTTTARLTEGLEGERGEESRTAGGERSELKVLSMCVYVCRCVARRCIRNECISRSLFLIAETSQQDSRKYRVIETTYRVRKSHCEFRVHRARFRYENILVE